MSDPMAELMGMLGEIERLNQKLAQAIEQHDRTVARFRILNWRMRSICSLVLVLVLFVAAWSYKG